MTVPSLSYLFSQCATMPQSACLSASFRSAFPGLLRGRLHMAGPTARSPILQCSMRCCFPISASSDGNCIFGRRVRSHAVRCFLDGEVRPASSRRPISRTFCFGNARVVFLHQASRAQQRTWTLCFTERRARRTLTRIVGVDRPNFRFFTKPPQRYTHTSHSSPPELNPLPLRQYIMAPSSLSRS